MTSKLASSIHAHSLTYSLSTSERIRWKQEKQRRKIAGRKIAGEKIAGKKKTSWQAFFETGHFIQG